MAISRKSAPFMLILGPNLFLIYQAAHLWQQKEMKSELGFDSSDTELRQVAAC